MDDANEQNDYNGPENIGEEVDNSDDKGAREIKVNLLGSIV